MHGIDYSQEEQLFSLFSMEVRIRCMGIGGDAKICNMRNF